MAVCAIPIQHIPQNKTDMLCPRSALVVTNLIPTQFNCQICVFNQGTHSYFHILKQFYSTSCSLLLLLICQEMKCSSSCSE